MKPRFARSVLLGIASCLLLVVLVGAQDVPVLRYFTWEVAQLGPEGEAAERTLLSQCEAEIGIRVELETLRTPEFLDRVAALAAANDLPDVFGVSSASIDEWARDGLLLNLQDYVDRDIAPIMDRYFSSAFAMTRYPKPDGDMYAFPYAIIHTVLWYNMDAFDEAGIPYPSEDGWTWDEFLNAAKALTVDRDNDGRIDRYGFWLYRGRYAQIEPWIYQNNGDLLNATRTRFEPNDNAIEALRFLTSLVTEHGVAPKPSEFAGFRMQDVFPLGFAAMWVDGNWQIANTRAQHREGGRAFRFAAAPIPRGPHWVQDTAFGWTDMFGIASTTRYPDQAWELIKCLTGEKRTVDLSFAGKIPVWRATSESEEWLELDQMPPNKAFLLEWAQHIGPTTYTMGWSEWRGYSDGSGLEGMIDAVLEGQMDLDTMLAEISVTANQVLARYYSE
jgi:multiple sugar transport system substrate-binding protein